MAELELLTGPARSGKTDRLLDRFAELLRTPLAKRPQGEAVWLAPTNRAVDHIRDELADRMPDSVILGGHVLTFDAFAESILEWSDANILPIGEAAKRNLLRNIITSLDRRRELPHFHRIRETTGFLDLVVNFIAELKREETWPEQFLKACVEAESKFQFRDQELGRIYDEYQRHLLDLDRYDQEGRFWAARMQMAQGFFGPFERLSLVIVDGFSDFTFTQQQILKALSKRVDRLCLSLPLEDPQPTPNRQKSLFEEDPEPNGLPQREELFAKPLAQRGRLRDHFDGQLHVISVKPPEPKTTTERTFRHLADHLFRGSRETPTLPQANGLEVWAATSRFHEVRQTALRVRSELERGTRPEHILVACRNLTRYASLIEEVWSESELPYHLEVGPPLSQAPLMRSLLAVLQLEIEDWPFDRLMAVLDDSRLNPGWDSWRDGTARRTLAHLLRTRKLHNGRRQIFSAVNRLAKAENLNEELREQAIIAHDLLMDLSEAIEPLRNAHVFADWSEVVIGLADTLGFRPATDLDDTASDLDRRDAQVWSRFTQMLREAAEAEQFQEQESRTISLPRFSRRLTDLLKSQSLPAAAPRFGGTDGGVVRIVEAEAVRNLDPEVLILIGLSENSFPGGSPRETFYTDQERAILNRHGLAMAERGGQLQQEMLLFYRLVTRPKRSLILCYPALGNRGDDLFPTPYLTAIQSLFDKSALKTQRFGRLDPVPTKREVLTATDLRLHATSEALSRRGGLLRTLLETDRFARTTHNVMAAIAMNAERFQTRRLTRHEGVMRSKPLLERVRQRFPKNYQFSITQLETFANCGFQFFMDYVLRIDPLDPSESTTDYRLRGTLVHQVLAVLHREWQPEMSPEEFATWLGESFPEQIEEVLGNRPADTPLQRALQEIETDLLRDWGGEFANQWQAYSAAMQKHWKEPPRPVLLEAGFGDLPEEEGADETEHDSVVIGSGANATRLRGRIDRIDVGEVEGQTVFNIVDYKTGSPPRFNEDKLSSGRALQLALYLYAVRKLELVEPGALPFQMGYWSLKETGFVTGLKDRSRKLTGLDADRLAWMDEELERIIPQLAKRIRNGSFWIHSPDEDCTARCPHNTICRVAQVRAIAETRNKVPPPLK